MFQTHPSNLLNFDLPVIGKNAPKVDSSLINFNSIRRKTSEVKIGHVSMGGDSPIVIQSMTNTDTEDALSTANQIKELWEAGSEIVRITVNTKKAAATVPTIKELLLKDKVTVPIVGDFHYNGHILLKEYPDCAQALDKYRINPGNVGVRNKREDNFMAMIEVAMRYNKPIRIGVNWGSLDQELLTRLMGENAALAQPQSDRVVIYRAMVQSAISSARLAQDLGLGKDKIVLSVKMSRVQDMVSVYQMLAHESDYALHLGLTEAGMSIKGIVSSSAALAILLQQGIGDTIRVSLTPEPGASRTQEVEVCRWLVQSLGFRQFRPLVTSCPGCGRTTSTYFQELAKEINDLLSKKINEWKVIYPGVESMNIAVMGCIVNGPGESRHANIGISLPGNGEDPKAAVYMDGKFCARLEGEHITSEFIQIVGNYVKSKFSAST